jgi:anti-sigma factor RsiW
MNMDKISVEQEDRLQDYLDGKLEGPALQQVKSDLTGSEAMQKRLEELRHVQDFLQKNSLMHPSAAFVERVMKNLSSTPLAAYPSPKNGLMLLMGVMVATGMLVMMISAGFFDQISGIVSFSNLEPVRKYVTPSIPAMTISGKLIMKVLIGINMVLAFVVLDRTVLRPFFQRRGTHSI